MNPSLQCNGVCFEAGAACSTLVASTFISCRHLLSMENREYRQRRRGNGRPCPVEREREEDVAQLKRQQTAKRVRRHRTKLKEIAEKARADHGIEQQHFVRSKCQFIVKMVV
jgi:hypothetical protein